MQRIQFTALYGKYHYLILTILLQYIDSTRCQHWSFEDQTTEQPTDIKYCCLL